MKVAMTNIRNPKMLRQKNATRKNDYRGVNHLKNKKKLDKANIVNYIDISVHRSKKRKNVRKANTVGSSPEKYFVFSYEITFRYSNIAPFF